MRTVEQRVAAGAEWLDKHKPGWERIVSLSVLDMTSTCRCVLGQVFTIEAKVVDGYDWAADEFFEIANHAEYLGFDALTGDGMVADYDLLHSAWTALLKERFDSGLLSDEAGHEPPQPPA